MRKHNPALALALALAAFGSPAFAQDIPPTYSGPMTVIDGDTVNVKGLPFRLIGLNAPELRSACYSEYILAYRAKLRLQSLLSFGHGVLIPAPCARGARDAYGRFCAHLVVDGVDVAETLISEGLAEPYQCGPWGCPRRSSWCKK